LTGERVTGGEKKKSKGRKLKKKGGLITKEYLKKKKYLKFALVGIQNIKGSGERKKKRGKARQDGRSGEKSKKSKIMKKRKKLLTQSQETRMAKFMDGKRGSKREKGESNI